jgi:hypothetical protein
MRHRGFSIARSIAVIFSALALNACEKAPEPLNFQKISVTAGPCNGVCPEYSLSVDENGAVGFIGKRHVLIQGGRATTLPAKNFAALKAALRTANIPALQTDYASDANCPVKSNGHAELIWQIEISGISKTIRQNLGCSSAPDANGRSVRLPPQLDVLFAALLDTTAASAWIYPPR